MSEHWSERDEIDAAFPDRSAGRWCRACSQFGSHHTEAHEAFRTMARRVVTPPGAPS